ncbi:MAG TPA: ATP-binding protein [Thermoanaerobaculia bacterium]|nr:ATP-binding protein [Thermoanaerobaculia bacterium]
MARIHLIVGPVGSGKSTLALRLAREHHAIRFNLDEWMTRLFRPDRPESGVIDWYVERAARGVEQIWMLTRQLIEHGTDVVLEIGLIRRDQRELFYSRVDAEAYELTIYVVDAPRDERRRRVLQRNEERGATFSVEVPPAFFELASDLWEPLSEIETDGRDVRFVGERLA